MTFMSSGHNPTYTKDAARKRRDGSIVHVNCPLIIGGVDLGDQYRKYYQVPVKSCKSYSMFEVCVYNSFILSHYSPCNHPISNYLAYRLQLYS